MSRPREMRSPAMTRIGRIRALLDEVATSGYGAAPAAAALCAAAVLRLPVTVPAIGGKLQRSYCRISRNTRCGG
ncbi:MAG TPA: hypothetical protein VGK20_13025 [Candidatus Binatia bacterium]|jgi:hypothetical protein